MSERPAPVTLSSLPSLPTISPASEESKLSLLVYGAPGVGKTMFAATAADDPRSAPVLFCDAEGGRLSISWRNEGIEVFPITDIKRDIKLLQDYFLGPDGVRKGIPFRTVVVDSLTEVATMAMDRQVATPNPRRALEDVAEYADWNVWTNQMKKLIKFLQMLPVHLIVTALERNEDGNIVPEFQGQRIPRLLPAKFNQVGRMYVVAQPNEGNKGTQYVRRLLLQSDVRIQAKDRSNPTGLLPREIESPTVSALLDRMADGRRLALEQAQNGRGSK